MLMGGLLSLLLGVVEEVEVDELLDLQRLRRHVLDHLRTHARTQIRLNSVGIHGGMGQEEGNFRTGPAGRGVRRRRPGR